MPDAPDTTSIDHRTFTITVRTPLAFLVVILVVLVLILRVLMFLFFLALVVFTMLLLVVVFTKEAHTTIVRGTPHTNGHAGGTGEGGHPR